MEEKRVVGNRRSEEELEQLKVDLNKLTFKLEEQTDFKGTQEQLDLMQAIERAYIDGAPICSDEEWEIMKRKHNYVESLASIAPSGRTWVKLFSPLPSIDKAGNMEELKNYFDKIKSMNLSGKFKVECKLDGLTANVRYKLSPYMDYYNLDCITSRGNGRFGLQLNPYALAGVKTNIPPEIHVDHIMKILDIKDINNLPAYVELRGEAVIPKNKHTEAKYGENAVLRSVASGMFNRKVPYNLDGVIQYITGEEIDKKTGIKGLYKTDLEGLFAKYSYHGLDIIFKGADGRLIASLDPNYGTENGDPNKFLRNDYIEISMDGYNEMITVYHKNGERYSFYPDYEELDVVFYSMSIGDSNIDTDKIKLIPGIKYISDIQFAEEYRKELETKNIPLTYRETNDIKNIYQAVFDFYGTDNDGKRNLSKPRLRNMYEYALDGVVIKPVDSNRETQGMFFRNHKNNANKIVCPKYPEDTIAVKLLSEIVKVKLVKIEQTETELGNITCSGILDKPYLTESGACVERINLHNPEWLEQNNWIKEGNEYEMIMSMDVIPVLLNPNM